MYGDVTVPGVLGAADEDAVAGGERMLVVVGGDGGRGFRAGTPRAKSAEARG